MPMPTHFLCLPLRSAELSSSLAVFKADVTRAGGVALPDSAIRPPGTLHLTLGVMTLNDEKVAQAKQILESLRPGDVLRQVRSIAKSAEPLEDKLSLTFQGLAAMGRPSETAILYVPPRDADQSLRRFCEEIKRPFREAGLMSEDRRPLLLHATVVNTVYVKGRDRKAPRMTFDGREVINRYDGFKWAESVGVSKVAICKMGAKKVGDQGDERYEVEGQVRF